MEKFNKQDLINRVTELNDVESKAAATRIVEYIAATIVNEVAEGKQVDWSQLGSFKPATQGARKGIMNGKAWTSPAKGTVKFSAASNFKKAVA